MSTLVFTRRACLEGRRDKSTSIELCASMVAKLECHLINMVQRKQRGGGKLVGLRTEVRSGERSEDSVRPRTFVSFLGTKCTLASVMGTRALRDRTEEVRMRGGGLPPERGTVDSSLERDYRRGRRGCPGGRALASAQARARIRGDHVGLEGGRCGGTPSDDSSASFRSSKKQESGDPGALQLSL